MVLVHNYQLFKEDLTPMLFNIFHKIETAWILPNSFYEATIALIPNHTKIQQRKQSLDKFPLWISMQSYSIKFFPTELKNTSKGSFTMIKYASPQDAGMVQYTEIHPCNPLHKQTQRKKCTWSFHWMLKKHLTKFSILSC